MLAVIGVVDLPEGLAGAGLGRRGQGVDDADPRHARGADPHERCAANDLAADPAKKIKPWSANEAREFLTLIREEPLYPAFVFALAYGLRRGEILGIGWEEIDFEAGVFRVRWQIQRIDGLLVRTPLKTEASKRDLPILDVLHEALDEAADRQIVAQRKAGESWHESDLVFTTRSGKPINPRHLSRRFEQLVAKHDLRPIRFHDLRHTLATLLKKLGVLPTDARDILGHARSSTTMEIYTHGDEESRRENVNLVGYELFTEPKRHELP